MPWSRLFYHLVAHSQRIMAYTPWKTEFRGLKEVESLKSVYPKAQGLQVLPFPLFLSYSKLSRPPMFSFISSSLFSVTSPCPKIVPQIFCPHLPSHYNPPPPGPVQSIMAQTGFPFIVFPEINTEGQYEKWPCKEALNTFWTTVRLLYIILCSVTHGKEPHNKCLLEFSFKYKNTY